MWKILQHNETGERHKAAHQPYEDCSKVLQLPDRLILAVADGHGTPQCCRADTGARFACEAACEVLALDHRELSAIHHRIKEYFDRKIQQDLKEHPLNQEEQALLEQMPAHYAYGTTLLCVMISPMGTYRFQIGDGSMFLLNEKGSLILSLPEDPHCYGNFTTSLVFEDAVHYIRWDFQSKPAAAVLLHTDGYFGGDNESWPLLNLLTDMPDRFPAQLLQEGSHGDDQTILLALSEKAAEAPVFCTGLEIEGRLHQLEEVYLFTQSELNRCDTVIKRLISKLCATDEQKSRSHKIRQLSEYQKKLDQLNAQLAATTLQALELHEQKKNLKATPPAPMPEDTEPLPEQEPEATAEAPAEEPAGAAAEPAQAEVSEKVSETL